MTARHTVLCICLFAAAGCRCGSDLVIGNSGGGSGGAGAGSAGGGNGGGSGGSGGGTSAAGGGDSCSDPSCGAVLCSQAAAAHGNYGCEYWAATTLNSAGSGTRFAVAILNIQAFDITATIEGAGLAAPATATIAPGAIHVFRLPWVSALSQNAMTNQRASVLQSDGAYHITTTGPVTVYQFNPLEFVDPAEPSPSYSSDASLLLPVGALTKNYTAIHAPAQLRGTWNMVPWCLDNGYPFITLVGASDTPTDVFVTPTAAILAGPGVAAIPIGQRTQLQVARGQTLQLVAAADCNDPVDLTGTRIEASAPIVAFVGAACMFVTGPLTQPGGSFSCDHVEEQLLPMETWGRTYAVSAFADRPTVPSLVRVIAQRDGTQVTFDPPAAHASVTLAAGEAMGFELQGDAVITGSNPILVAQFMYSAGRGMNTPEAVGDPSMVLEVPTEQYRPLSAFLTPDTYSDNFVNVVSSATSAPLIDGVAVTAPRRAIGGSGLSSWQVRVGPGAHTVESAGGEPLGIKVYGAAASTSYAYPGGLDLKHITLL